MSSWVRPEGNGRKANRSATPTNIPPNCQLSEFIFSGSNGATFEGMVPVLALRLPNEYAFDGWGRRIMYAVSEDLTRTNSFLTILASDPSARMTIYTPEGNSKSVTAGYVLLSMGPDGFGGYSRVGGTTRLNTNSVNTDEAQNRDCNVVGGVINPTGLNGIFVQKDPTQDPGNPLNSFDDLVVFDTRIGFSTPSFSDFYRGSGSSGSGSGGGPCFGHSCLR
jgi:hypothetical protein